MEHGLKSFNQFIWELGPHGIFKNLMSARPDYLAILDWAIFTWIMVLLAVVVQPM